MQKFDQVEYHIPPECQGQIVEVSYGCDEDYVYRKTYDRSDRTTAYARFEHPDTEDQEFDFDPWNGEPKLGDEVPFTKDQVEEWEPVVSYVWAQTDIAIDVSVCIGEVGGQWFISTRDDSGGDDDCGDKRYASKEDASRAACEFAEENDEAAEGEDAAAYLKRQLIETAGESKPAACGKGRQ